MGLEMSSWVWGEISCWLCGATSTPYQLCAPTSLGISGTYHKTPPTGAGTPQTDQTWVCFAGGTAWSFWQPVLRPFISATVSNCYDGNFFDCPPLGLSSDAYWSLVLHLATKTLQPTSTPQHHGPLSPPPTLTSLNLAEVNPHFPILGNVQWVQL